MRKDRNAMGFWGPNMIAVLEWAKQQPDFPGPDTFGAWADAKLGVETPQGEFVETTAARWLMAIRVASKASPAPQLSNRGLR